MFVFSPKTNFTRLQLALFAGGRSGYSRTAIAELRTALELVMTGAYVSFYPDDENYVAWKIGSGDLTFGRYRSRLLGNLCPERIDDFHSRQN
jgi:hypothetical protein